MLVALYTEAWLRSHGSWSQPCASQPLVWAYLPWLFAIWFLILACKQCYHRQLLDCWGNIWLPTVLTALLRCIWKLDAHPGLLTFCFRRPRVVCYDRLRGWGHRGDEPEAFLWGFVSWSWMSCSSREIIIKEWLRKVINMNISKQSSIVFMRTVIFIFMPWTFLCV